MVTGIWNRLIENCIACFKPVEKRAIDEQFFPRKTRCPFTQFIHSKAENYGQKFWLAVDLRTKYLLNASPFCSGSREWPSDQRLSEYVLM